LKWQGRESKMKSIIAIFFLVVFCVSNGWAQGASAAQSSGQNQAASAGAQPSSTQSAKRVRIGVAQVMSTVSPSLATDGWQQELVDDLDFLGAKGVILSSDPNDRDATLEQAKQANCDYVILTTVTTYKSVGVGEKITSVLGHGNLGGVGGTGQGRVELGAEAKVFQPDSPVPIFDANNDFRQNDPTATAKGLLRTEARDVLLQLKRVQNSKENGGTSHPPSSSSATPKQ